jgi:hypothetical protein
VHVDKARAVAKYANNLTVSEGEGNAACGDLPVRCCQRLCCRRICHPPRPMMFAAATATAAAAVATAGPNGVRSHTPWSG